MPLPSERKPRELTPWYVLLPVATVCAWAGLASLSAHRAVLAIPLFVLGGVLLLPIVLRVKLTYYPGEVYAMDEEIPDEDAV